MRAVELSTGTIQYRDSGHGPPILFVHGIFANGALWRKVIAALPPDVRSIAPDWPLGSHSIAMSAGADMSPLGVARLIREFIEALNLHKVTLVANDTGGAITQLLLADGCDRIGRVVLTPCDSFDNFLPRSIRVIQYLARVPSAFQMGIQPLRIRWVRRLVYRTLAKHRVPDDIAISWVRPLLTDREIRRDLTRFLRAIDYHDTLSAVEALRTFTEPVLLLWARKAPYFPFSHAERLAAVFPNACVVELPDSFTFVSEDQPELTAREIARFVRESPAPSAPTSGRDRT